MTTETDDTRKRWQETGEAIQDEICRLNTAVREGAEPWIDTAFGPHTLSYMDANMDGHFYARGGDKTSRFGRRFFCIGNDIRFAQLLKRAGVERNPLFAEFAYTGE